MFRVKKLVSAIASILAIGMLFTGCGGNASKTGNENKPTNSSSAAVGEKTKLSIWWAGQDKFKKPLLEAVKEYQDKNPNVEIDPKWQPTFDYYDKYKIALSGKTAPDLVKIDHVFVQALGYNKQIADMSALGAEKVQDKFVPSTWKSNMYNGKVFALPLDANTLALMYNKDILDKAGVAPPNTFDELIKASLAVNKLNLEGTVGFTLPVISGAATGSSSFLTYEFVSWLARNGGSILNDDWTKCTLDQPQAIHTLEQLSSVIKSGAAPANIFMEGEFYKGKVGMIEMGPWSVPQITGKAAPAKFGVVPLVKLTDSGSVSGPLGLYSLAISKQCKNLQEAYKFSEFLATDYDLQLSYSKETNLMPSLKEVYKDPFFDNDIWKIYIEQLNNTVARPGTPVWPEVDKYLTTALQEALTGEKSPEQALKDATVKCDQALAKVKSK